MIVQLSAGQGPEECQLAVGRLFDALKKEYPGIKLCAQKEGRRKGCYASISFETKEDLSGLEGTVLWICKSPFRPGHKRKNWYVDVSVIPDRQKVSREADYRIEKFHCGGKGGQNVNKVETILQDKEQMAQQLQTNQAWQEHNRIVRGNPVRIYEGQDFVLKK